MDFKVYSNPARNKIMVNRADTQVKSMSIIDSTGRVVYTNNESLTGKKSFNSNLARGNNTN